MDFLKDFGVQPVLLIAQTVNFFILLFLLKKLLYGPLLRILRQRRQKIADSLKNAEKIEKQLLKTTEEKEKVLLDASKEAQKIIVEATLSASAIIDEARKKVQKDIDILFENGRRSIEIEREKMHMEIREDIAGLIEKSLTKVLTTSLDPARQKKEVSEAIKNLV